MVSGYVYVDDEEQGPIAGAAPGRLVRNATLRPPWIVVHHSLDRVLVAQWPGRLFRVEVVPPSTREERAAMERAAAELAVDAGYTRAIAVEVLEELPAPSLFGPHGDAVGALGSPTS